MSFRGNKWLYRTLMTMSIVMVFACVSYAQITVSISGEPVASGTPLPASVPAPSVSFKVKAIPAVSTGTVTQVDFYRNDVLYKTLMSAPWEITESGLGQDTYTYHARAYDSPDNWAESGDFVMVVETAHIVRMGGPIPRPSPSPAYYTHGPDPLFDHTEDIKLAIAHLSGQGGGTLLFPCAPLYVPPVVGQNPDFAGKAVYNVSDTITVPSNVTLQGESSEWWGKCVIFWYDVKGVYGETTGGDPPLTCTGTAPVNLTNKPMFLIRENTDRVRFRDLAIQSRASGRTNCQPRNDFVKYFAEQTSGIEMNPDGDPKCTLDPCGGDISDIIFENVTISDFTYGIKAVSPGHTAHEISGVRIRGYNAHTNFRQLVIDSPAAYDWDVQNLNIVTMEEGQGGVDIVNAGNPSENTPNNTKLKFLQLNCIGNQARDPEFCVQVEKHEGLYFRQMHQEGVDDGFIVKDLTERDPAETNTEPIVVESSMATGRFYDASMTLYLIANAVVAAPELETPTLADDGRLLFIDESEGSDGGVDSTVIDCGDYHRDWTNTPNPSGTPVPGMLYTHSERNRASFFANDGSGPTYTMPHTTCPSDISGVGGDFFDSGVLPNEPGLYSNTLDSSTCSACNAADMLEYLLGQGGSVYIGDDFTLDRTVTIPKGSQIIGDGDAELVLDSLRDDDLFLIDVFVPSDAAGFQSGIVIRNLKMKTEQAGKIGIHLAGEYSTTDTGSSRDLQFSGLTLNGFEKGIYASSLNLVDPLARQPMVDGFSLKNISIEAPLGAPANFDETAIEIFSSNASNWNVMNLTTTSKINGAIGWDQTYGGYLGLQDVRCRGIDVEATGEVLETMEDCLKLRMVSGSYLSGLRKTENVTNAVTLDLSNLVSEDPLQGRQPSLVTFRNNDFTGGTVKVVGKSFITSMNNKYGDFEVDTTNEADLSRLTYCDDDFPVTSPHYSGLKPYHPNLWVGIETPTRIECGPRPVPWDDPLTWGGGNGDVPLVGKFDDDSKEDLVIFRPTTPEFRIKRRDTANTERIIPFGVAGDTPFVGKFLPGNRDQLLVFKITGTSPTWRMYDPKTCPGGGCLSASWSWGTWNDIPLIGNFIDDANDVDEIAVYRPLDNTFYIINPYTGANVTLTTPADHDSAVIVVGDFQGLGYDQIAQYEASAGTWYILDPASGTTITAGWGIGPGDVPVTGRYFPPGGSPAVQCSQLGIWRPDQQILYVADATSGCGGRNKSMEWGSNNDFPVTAAPASPIANCVHDPVNNLLNCTNDIPLTISDDGLIDRPVSYRPTKGAYTEGIANGQWWVHDKFVYP